MRKQRLKVLTDANGRATYHPQFRLWWLGKWRDYDVTRLTDASAAINYLKKQDKTESYIYPVKRGLGGLD